MNAKSYQERIEALAEQSVREQLRKYEIERETAEVYLDTARIVREQAVSRHKQDMIEAEQRIKLAEVSVQNYREFQRPSRLHGISIRQDTLSGKWVAELDDLRADGDTAAMAMENFDHIFLYG